MRAPQSDNSWSVFYPGDYLHFGNLVNAKNQRLSGEGGEFIASYGNGNWLALWKIYESLGVQDQGSYTPSHGFPYVSRTRLSLLRVVERTNLFQSFGELPELQP